MLCFRNEVMQDRWISLPQLAFDCMLKTTLVKISLISISDPTCLLRLTFMTEVRTPIKDTQRADFEMVKNKRLTVADQLTATATFRCARIYPTCCKRTHLMMVHHSITHTYCYNLRWGEGEFESDIKIRPSISRNIRVNNCSRQLEEINFVRARAQKPLFLFLAEVYMRDERYKIIDAESPKTIK